LKKETEAALHPTFTHAARTLGVAQGVGGCEGSPQQSELPLLTDFLSEKRTTLMKPKAIAESNKDNI